MTLDRSILMSDSKKKIQDEEMEASERRARRLQEISEEMKNPNDHVMADILAQIEANNKKKYTEE